MGARPIPVHHTMLSHPATGDEAAPALPADVDARRVEELALLDRTFDGTAVLLAGLANVVMQLSWLEIGHGVAHSTVSSGQIFKHPLKRYRTTIGYLMVAQFGSPALRTAYREAVNTSHRQVRSGPDSPVKYNAFNRDLQLWVASCIFYGTLDIAVREYGALSPQQEEILLRAGARWATTLQVPQEMWHADMEEFWSYWETGLERARFDETTAPYLRALLEFEFVAKPLRPFLRPLAWANLGFLPAELREGLGYAWSEREQRRHDALLRGIGYLSRPVPALVRQAPARSMLWNLQLRHLLGRPLV